MRTLLERLYEHLPSATELPQGTYDGIAWPKLPFRGAWQGKVFTGDGVVNRIGPLLLIPGHVSLQGGEVVIDYPQLGLRDYLKPVSSTVWLGKLGTEGRIWFTLEAVT